MCNLNVLDILAIQECMVGYKRLIEFLPPVDDVEEELKEQRLKLIDRITNVCEDLIAEEKNKHLFGYANSEVDKWKISKR